MQCHVVHKNNESCECYPHSEHLPHTVNPHVSKRMGIKCVLSIQTGLALPPPQPPPPAPIKFKRQNHFLVILSAPSLTRHSSFPQLPNESLLPSRFCVAGFFFPLLWEPRCFSRGRPTQSIHASPRRFCVDSRFPVRHLERLHLQLHQNKHAVDQYRSETTLPVSLHVCTQAGHVVRVSTSADTSLRILAFPCLIRAAEVAGLGFCIPLRKIVCDEFIFLLGSIIRTIESDSYCRL